MRVLGIESSCDETGIAVYDTAQGLLSHHVYSQVAMHTAFGGVVPELASRDHIHRVIALTDLALKDSGCSLSGIDAVAVTKGPGLGGALLVGNAVAAALGFATAKPVLGIHHLEGHLLSPLLADPAPTFPFVALLVSGGHTQLMQVEKVGHYRILGETVDDAAGEAFDKTASILGMGYPGGPALSKLAATGDPTRFKLPRPMLHSGDLDFSFSGLKTAVVTLTRKLGALDDKDKCDMAAAFELSIVDVLVTKSLAALDETGLKSLVVAGGVGANQRLRQSLNAALSTRGATAYFPPLHLCTDNGAMIAFAGALRLANDTSPLAQPLHSKGVGIGEFSVRPRWPLNEI